MPVLVWCFSGVAGAAGGLGGFLPPLIMGWVYGVEHSYAIGLMLLSDVALAAAVYTGVRMAGLAPPPVRPGWMVAPRAQPSGWCST